LCTEGIDYSIKDHHNTTNPNNEVPPQDAQLQGVVLMASTQLQTQTVKFLHNMHNFKGLSKDKCKIQQRASNGKEMHKFQVN
jgi:hypothetical protein